MQLGEQSGKSEKYIINHTDDEAVMEYFPVSIWILISDVGWSSHEVGARSVHVVFVCTLLAVVPGQAVSTFQSTFFFGTMGGYPVAGTNFQTHVQRSNQSSECQEIQHDS